MHRHRQLTVRPILTYRIRTTNKTRTLTDVPPQPHARRHRHCRPTIPKQPPLLSLIQKHEQLPRQNYHFSHRQSVDRGGKRYGDGVCKQVFCVIDGLDLRSVRPNRARRSSEESKQDASNVQS